MTRDGRTREMREHDRMMGEREVCEVSGCGQPCYRKGLCRDCYDAGLEDKADHDADLRHEWGER